MKYVLICFALLFSQASYAGVEVHEFQSAADEERYQKMIDELRCLVCQNQNLADSNSDLAKDLRGKTYELIRDGATDDEIIEYMVNRYGDFVLYRPPFKTSTLLLWVGPFIILLIMLWFLIRFIRRSAATQEVNLDTAEKDLAKQLLNENSKDKTA